MIGRPVIVVSHFRSGTHLLMDLIRKQFDDCRPAARPLANIHDSYLSLDRLAAAHHRPLGREGASKLLSRAPRPLCKTHAMPDFGDVRPDCRPLLDEILGAGQILYAVRDGRKVMCSLYAWTQNFDGGWAAAPGEGPAFGQFLRRVHSGGHTWPEYWARHVQRWAARPDAVVIRFEDVIERTEEVLARLEGVLSIPARRRRPLLPRPITGGGQTKLAHLLGRLESTNIHNGRFRPMTPEEAFSPEDEAFFWSEAGEAMEALGYGRTRP